MNDYSHLKAQDGEGEEKSLLSKGDTKPEEAKELLASMLKISKLIQDVTIQPYLFIF